MIWVRMYRAALRVLPRELRRRHGRAMEAMYVREVGRARSGGPLRAAAAASMGILDVLRRGWYERRRTRRREAGDARAPSSRHARTLEGTMDGLGQDLRQTLRSLAKSPRFTVVAVLTLALGVGANSAIFSVLNAVVLQPLPFPAGDRFVLPAWRTPHGPGGLQNALTPMRFEYFRDHTSSFEAMATYRSFLARMESAEGVVGVPGLRVSHGFLTVLGYEPVMGRDFTLEEDVPDGPPVALVSHGFWRTRLAAADDVVGRSVRIDERPYTVVGVLPPDFDFPLVDDEVDVDEIEVLVPLGVRADPRDEGANFPAIARLRPDVTRDEARAEMSRLLEPFRALYPNQVYENERGMTLASYQELFVGDAVRALWIVMGAVALVLLIACANVANLFLARAAQRRTEVALRAALGATRARVARYVLTESVVVALAAGVVGLLLALWGVRALVALSPAELPRMGDIGVDLRVVAFTFLAALATGLAFGGVAVWPALQTRLAEVLKEGARGSSGRGRGRQGLLVAQSALAMVLLVGAGLLIGTLVGLRGVDAGFETRGMMAVRFPFKPAGYATARDVWELERSVLEQLRGAPGIAGIAAASNLPLERGLNFPMSIAGRPDHYEGAVEWRGVTPGYFETLGIGLRAGRTFSASDESAGEPVAIVNEAFVRRWFPDESPIGRRVEIGRFRGEYSHPSMEGAGVEIVGVVADMREISLRAEPRRTIYVPAAQAHDVLVDALDRMPVFVARSSGSGADLQGTLREAIRAADPALPAPEVFPLDRMIAESLARERFGAALLTSFATLALALTAFGVYGVLAYTVRQRRQEIGIRMALGAGGAAVTRMVALQALGPVALGLVLGAGAALALSGVLAGFLWGVSPTDPTTLGVVAGILLGVAGLASWLPAREALGLDPVRSLRQE